MKRIGATESNNIVKTVVVGTLTALGMIMVLAGILSVLIVHDKVTPEMPDLFAVAILGISLFLGSLLTNVMKNEVSVVCSLLVCASVLVILLLCNIVFFDGEYGNAWVKAIAMFAGTAAAYFLCLFRKNKKGEKYRRYLR